MPITATFLFFDIFFAIIWTYLFLRNRSTRQEMIIIGIVALVFTPMFVFLNLEAFPENTEILQYTSLSLADFLFSFLFAGIAAVIFHNVFGKHYRIKKSTKLLINHTAERWFLQLFLIVTIWAWLTVFFVYVVETTPFQAIVAAGLMVGSYMVASRRDLLWNSIWSAILMSAILFILYEISFFKNNVDLSEAWWIASTNTNRFVASVPLNALVWAFTMGFVLGPLYEYARDIKLIGPKK